MKKHYILTTIVIDILVLLVFVIGTGIFTYIVSVEEMKSFKELAAEKETTFIRVIDSDKTEFELLSDYLNGTFVIDEPEHDDNIGYANCLYLSDKTYYNAGLVSGVYGLDAEATDCLMSISEYARNEWDMEVPDSIFTCAYKSTGLIKCIPDNDELYYYASYYTLLICHPMKIAVMKNLGIFIILAVALLIAETVITVVMFRIYKTRKSYETKSRHLTRSVAHELESPLAETKTYLSNWEKYTDEERREYRKKIDAKVDSMVDMINAFLAMENISSGYVRLTVEEVDLSSLIRSVYKHMKYMAEERGLVVELPDDSGDTAGADGVDGVDDAEHLVKADLKYLKIALNNYMNHALKSATREVKVRVQRSGDIVRVSFENDRGAGGAGDSAGLQIGEDIMDIHGFSHGTEMKENGTVSWFEARTN
ncbi:MAG: HAMP domain-containing histidine kinase [Saccharofermentans sp.]|nr:HAMP domain-containing histidine kinase [Saccharofermentans sp.]